MTEHISQNDVFLIQFLNDIKKSGELEERTKAELKRIEAEENTRGWEDIYDLEQDGVL